MFLGLNSSDLHARFERLPAFFRDSKPFGEKKVNKKLKGLGHGTSWHFFDRIFRLVQPTIRTRTPKNDRETATNPHNHPATFLRLSQSSWPHWDACSFGHLAPSESDVTIRLQGNTSDKWIFCRRGPWLSSGFSLGQNPSEVTAHEANGGFLLMAKTLPK